MANDFLNGFQSIDYVKRHENNEEDIMQVIKEQMSKIKLFLNKQDGFCDSSKLDSSLNEITISDDLGYMCEHSYIWDCTRECDKYRKENISGHNGTRRPFETYENTMVRLMFPYNGKIVYNYMPHIDFSPIFHHLTYICFKYCGLRYDSFLNGKMDTYFIYLPTDIFYEEDLFIHDMGVLEENQIYSIFKILKNILPNHVYIVLKENLCRKLG